MGQTTSVIDFNAIYYAALRPTVPLPARPFTTLTDWVLAGYTKVAEPDGDTGALWTIDYEFKEKRPAGSKMATGHGITKGGLSSITFAVPRTDETTLLLALPDGALDGEMITADGAVEYRQIVLVTDNNVYWAKKASATGKLPIEHKNSEWGITSFEFTCFEDSDNDAAGTANFGIFKMLS